MAATMLSVLWLDGEPVFKALSTSSDLSSHCVSFGTAGGDSSRLLVSGDGTQETLVLNRRCHLGRP